MKGKKFAEVLMLICAVALVMAGILSLAAIPKDEVAIDNSKLLKDGMFNAQNTGQKVTIILDDERLKPAFDRQMGIAFQASMVRRDVERFERLKDGGYHWKRVSSNAVDPLRYKTLYGETYKGKRVSLDPAFEAKIKTTENLGVENLTEISSKKFENGKTKRKFHVVKKDGFSYFTNAGDVVFGDLSEANPVKLDAQVGKFRVKYTKMDLDKKSVALIGVQRGQLIKVDPEIGKPIVIDGNLNEMATKEDIVDRMKKNHMIMFAIALVGALVLAVAALKFGGTIGSAGKKATGGKDKEFDDIYSGSREAMRNTRQFDSANMSPEDAKDQRNRDYLGENRKNKKKK